MAGVIATDRLRAGQTLRLGFSLALRWRIVGARIGTGSAKYVVTIKFVKLQAYKAV